MVHNVLLSICLFTFIAEKKMFMPNVVLSYASLRKPIGPEYVLINASALPDADIFFPSLSSLLCFFSFYKRKIALCDDVVV